MHRYKGVRVGGAQKMLALFENPSVQLLSFGLLAGGVQEIRQVVHGTERVWMVPTKMFVPCVESFAVEPICLIGPALVLEQRRKVVRGVQRVTMEWSQDLNPQRLCFSVKLFGVLQPTHLVPEKS